MEGMHVRPRYGSEVLRRFHLSERAVLGAGGESRVYALDEERVLRVWGAGTTEAKVKDLQRFYRSLDTSGVDFAVPDILESGQEGEFLFSIETRLPGRSLTASIGELDSKARMHALRALVRVAGEVRKLRSGFEGYGELLAEESLRRKGWSEFLIDRAHVTLKDSYESFAQEVARLDQVVAEWEGDVRSTVGSPEPELVHGDFFPGNVLVNDAGELTAVIDFSPMTVSGDWRMDVTGAQIFLALGDVDEREDQEIVDREVASLYGVSPEVIDVYRRYYALYFSAARQDDSPLYEWCVRQLSSSP